MSGLIWVQTVYKSFQQTTLGDKELKYCITLCIDFFYQRFIIEECFCRGINPGSCKVRCTKKVPFTVIMRIYSSGLMFGYKIENIG